jgi:hypothetical protein
MSNSPVNDHHSIAVTPPPPAPPAPPAAPNSVQERATDRLKAAKDRYAHQWPYALAVLLCITSFIGAGFAGVFIGEIVAQDMSHDLTIHLLYLAAVLLCWGGSFFLIAKYLAWKRFVIGTLFISLLVAIFCGILYDDLD